MRSQQTKLFKSMLLVVLMILLMFSAACVGLVREIASLIPGSSSGEVGTWPTGGAYSFAADDVSNYDPDDTWVFYWYVCGSDLESRSGLATTDIQEILDCTLPANVKVVIETGGAKSWQNDVISSDSIGRYLYEGDSLTLIEEISSANMGEEKTLTEFLQFCNERYPADHQVVIFWNHGGGTLNGVIFDEQYDFDSLTLLEVERAFEAAPAVSGIYEMIGFDACLMATVDMASVLQGHARYMVASEEVEYGAGWSYDGFLSEFAQGGPKGGAVLGAVICDSFYRACVEADCADMATLSVVDLSKVGVLLDAYKDAGDEILLDGCTERVSYFGAFGRAARAAENYGGNNDEQGYYHMVDLGDLVEKLSLDVATKLDNEDELMHALSECVVYQVKGSLRQEASGLACYYNFGGGIDGGLDGIASFQELGTNKSLSIYYAYASLGYLGDNDATYVKNLAEEAGYTNFTITQDLFAGWTGNLDGVSIKPSEDDGWLVQLTKEEAECISDVSLEIFHEDTAAGGYASFGYALAVNMPYYGELKSWFPYGHDAIDGVFLSVKPVGHTEDYYIYASPILLNKERYTLLIGHVHTDRIILGAVRGETEVVGMAERDLRQLVPGDVVEPLFNVTDTVDAGGTVEEKTIGSITITEDTEIYQRDFPSGNYRVRFIMTDFSGTQYVSQSAAYVSP